MIHINRTANCKKGFTGFVKTLAIGCGAGAVVAGCSLVGKTVSLPVDATQAVLSGFSATKPFDQVDLQDSLLRFADDFMNTVTLTAEKLQQNGKPVSRDEQILVKYIFSSNMLALATGANSIANLVNIVVFVAISRSRVEDYWLPKVYGDSAMSMLEVLREREQQIWTLADQVLQSAQQAELREALDLWRKGHPSASDGVGGFASLSLVNEVINSSTRSKASSSSGSNVFALLNMDPLASLDPATRELTETRLFAERALFIGQRMPLLIEWQMELLASRTLKNPEVGQLLSGTTLIAEAGDRLSRTVEQLPSFISAEREKLVAVLHSEKRGLGELSRQVGQAMGEGAKMADSTDKALQSYNAIITQMEKWPDDPSSEPFRINDYATAAVEISQMSQRLNELLLTLQTSLDPANLERVSTIADSLTKQAQQRSEQVVDYAFRKAILFVAIGSIIFCLSLLASALLYKYLSAKQMGRVRV
ncbi:hypothetical protein F6R98_08545 [Candidatus Methylospira mobilis]|uniref:Uncharacterized protein n=1 Tax=Candidatus Methylospira mobilis TaxID=1808979 RepID=A0A5Q0BKL9_9GAMM|nr:hypothetical protein [Candidatus Methylospira mobilis]QFY42667.1 hypothetical protein F6R98_08545 [Candidatus Methylospira mobilis]WNV04215.1 hypothetical protein RP726_17670 [Candidatus Methylospira mobilis]